ncbi:unnamed protein product [Meloidogyne enterolobii]|uniref:Uncharacterized protein n=2 Tax=Meloidogyne enterolobii TaxID=390850 RepID=A0ACB0YJL3_MELEN|nr:unnamed protein product [Meloidogyne enterolobii]
MRKQNQQQKQSQKQQFSKQINAQTLRNSFLEQAAYLLNSITTSPVQQQKEEEEKQNDKNNKKENNSYNLLARLALREVRELCFGDQIRMHKNFKRNYCKRCFNCWLAPESGKNFFSLKIKQISKQKTIVLKCQSCQNNKTIPFNVNYKSRNEKVNNDF